MSKKRTLDEIRQTKDSHYRAPRSHELILVDTTFKGIPEGWWLNITPLAAIDPDNWIVAVLKRGKKSWVTEVCNSGFTNPQDAYDWGIEFINGQLEK